MNIDVKHTYLVNPGLWELTGIYYDKNNNAYPQKGELIITHDPDLWVVEGQITITTEQTQSVTSRYEIQPLAPGATYTDWTSEAGGPEPIFGLFVLVGDTIMSPWQSRSGTYWGQEILTRVSDTEYQGRGFAFLKEEKVSAWATRVTLAG